METILTNARLMTEEGAFDGTVVLRGSNIAAVDQGRSSLPSAVDCEGDILAPGLIEIHTDNMERHFQPRPKVIWPNGLAAAIAHDAQMAASGVTTVYDAVCAGSHESKRDFRTKVYWQMIEAITAGMREGLYRVDHKLHLRCELSDPHLMDYAEPVADNPLLALISLMDHTPGQRQWRDIEHLRTYAVGSGQSEAEFEADLKTRMETGPLAVASNWTKVLGLYRERHIPIASHDDTTEEHVESAVQSGVTISEFPTTLEAARAARTAGLATVAGSPNVVRGGSHSGGVAVRDLFDEGVLDGLSSDYVPAALLQSVIRLSVDFEISLEKTIGLVTWGVADMLDLRDRGRLVAGLRGDCARFRFAGETPVVREVYSAGRRVV